MSERQQHWERVYGEKDPGEVSWFQPRPDRSLALIAASGVEREDPIIDVGAGASTLVDALLAQGFRDITVVDIAQNALDISRRRLGPETADRVRWCRADVTRFTPERRFRFWHDCAVFHFLTDPSDRQRYVDVLDRAVLPDADVVVATFAADGPERCSGLPVARYDEAAIAGVFAPRFRLVDSARELHVTPAGKEQAFVYFHFRRLSSTG